MKIVIIGYSGSGKSTLAENLSRHYSIPKLHMDTLQFQPGWIDSDRDWMEKEMRQFLSDHRDWVIDGNYSWCCYEERMEQADQIIFLNFSRWNCLFRAWKRYRRYKGRVRESMAAGCPERFDYGIHPLDPLGRSPSQTGHTLSDYRPKLSRQICLSQESKRAGCVSKKHTIKRLGYQSQP